jgi:hypothetical protein
MPTGVYKTTDIPPDKVKDVVAGYMLDNPEKIDEVEQTDGNWTVIATWPGAGETTKKQAG